MDFKENSYLDASAEEAYDKFRRSRGILGITLGKSEELKNFADVQKEAKAFNNSYLGIIKVPLEEIVGSCGKIEDFDKNFIPKNKIVKMRWCNIYKEMLQDGNLPPVQLYKIKNEYFAYDGNHRISVAKYLNAKVIEAEVTEFFPSGEDVKDVIYWEKFYFFKQTGITEIESETPGAYDRYFRRIENFYKRHKSSSSIEYNFKEISREWLKRVYLPIIEIMEINGISEESRKEKFGDIFIDFLDYKRYLEEGGKRRIGYCYSLISYINNVKKNDSLNSKKGIYLDSYIISVFLNLYRYDVEWSLSEEKLQKLLYIRKFFRTTISNEIKIISKMEKYLNENNLELSEESLDNWNRDFFNPLYILLAREVEEREIGCFKKYPSIIEDRGRIFLELIAYKKIFENKYQKSLTNFELVLLYILEVAYPLGKVIEENKIPSEETGNIYFILSKRYANFLKYNSKTTFERLYKIYNEDNKSVFQEWLFLNIYGKSKGIPDILGDLKKVLSEDEIKIVDELMEKYGKTSNYKTTFYLKEFKEEYKDDEKTWVKKLEEDLLALSTSSEIMIIFNTYLLMEFIKDTPYPYTLIDFYVAILSFSKELWEDRHFVDILTLAREYIDSFQYEL